LTMRNLPSGRAIAFTTELVGVSLTDPEQFVDLFDFAWIDTFNGTAGGISTTANSIDVDPLSGTGGITITSVNGVDVPEPATLVLLCAGLLVLGLVKRGRSLANPFGGT
jgi:hypothetical protein